ncbi:uncharacterized protein LOC113231452 isoform X2 [Hyposmocoma kahamanoa]|uniref:uncharacterized protein LOC113231452 isoform X2 n=1 Tax=Hyposmocoma kahamanoa TaxID=1477025 RepID=UPI000E6D8115|nr:uncharacterized protein LOC113231452 isoform X2 [Hyposmocoma kahamanoa]
MVPSGSSVRRRSLRNVHEYGESFEQRVISCGSSTLYCLAPIIKVLQEYYGVEAGFITSIHAMTPSLKPLDGLCLRGKHWRDHRSILQNIIPATTEACKALGKIIPQVRDKLSGLAFRVPIVNVSVLDLTIRLLKPTTIDDIVRNIERVSKTTMKDIITTCKEERVSSDFMNETHSCIVDAGSSLQLAPNFFKIICWYENECSYACRVVDLIHLSEKQFEKAEANRLAQIKIKISKGQNVNQQTEDSLKNIQESCRVFELETKPTDKKNIKSPLRPVLLKKPMILNHSAHSSTITASEPNKNKVELFKIWNDENIINNANNVRQNRESFFQTCNKPGSGVGNTQERLEKVKEEFSKMVSITELLLKKSYSNKLSFNFDPPKESLDIVKTGTDIKEPVQQENNQKYIKLDMSGDGKISDSTLHLGCSKNTVPNVCDKKISDLSMVETIKSLHSINKNFLLPGKKSPIHGDPIAKGDAENKTTKNTESTTKLPNKSIAFKTQMSDTFSNIIMKFHLQPTVTSMRITNKDNTNEETTNKISHANVDVNMPVQILTTSEPSVDIEKNTATRENEQHLEDVQKNQKTINVLDNMKKIKNIDRIGVELKRRSIVLFHEKNSSADTGKVFCEQVCMQFDDGFQEQMKVTEEKKTMHTSIPSPSSATCTYTMNASSAVKKHDIYDKLDSPDGTDSDNSLNAKKSQVIHIADLTNSLDDLKRLDKICRIIEMSDELSDKLFSPLDNYKAEGRTKRWSFKDLCDRICLDEFSDQVFGK